MRFILAWIFIALGASSHAEDLTLEQIRKELDGQQVMIIGSTFPLLPPVPERYSPTANKLVDWFHMDGNPESGFQRSRGAGEYAPVAVRGQTAQIVRVEETRSAFETRPVGGTDVFGKPIPDGAAKNPYITVIVRMSEGSTYYGATGYYSTLMGKSLQLISQIERNRTEIGGYLETLAGKNLYKLGYTEVYKPDVALNDLLSFNRRPLSKEYGIENLVPMKVLETKYLEAENAVVIKVSLPSGATQLLFGDLQFYDQEYSQPVPPLERMGIRAVEKIPTKYTSRELVAIKKSEIFRGMSVDALYASWGYPAKTNDWGKGGKQYIFGSSQYVYVKNSVVSDWQSVR